MSTQQYVCATEEFSGDFHVLISLHNLILSE